ncbi:MAG: CoA transferase [Burkholderiaceae bacterium]
MTTSSRTGPDTVWREATDGTGALQGVRIVDLSRVLAGPLCTQMLADHGADVIKIEPPFGDETRQLGPPFDDSGTASYYSAVNRGKRAFSLDLTAPEERRILLGLLEGADVLIENFLPGTMEKWQLGYESVLAPRFPKLIHCSISGFGDTGPLGGSPGYDAVLQAMCGLMSVNGSPQSGPTRIGIPIVDHLTGYAAMNGIVMALYHRERTGRAQRVEATLFDTALSLLVPHASNWMHSGKTPQLLGSAHPNIAPYDSFSASDGAVFLGILNDSQFRRFCRCIDHPTLADDPRFASNAVRLANRDALRAEIETAFAKWDKASLCQKLMSAGIPAGPVNTVPEALTAAHAKHRGMFIDEPGYRGLGVPIRMHGSPGRVGDRPPAFDEHAFLKEKLQSRTPRPDMA